MCNSLPGILGKAQDPVINSLLVYLTSAWGSKGTVGRGREHGLGWPSTWPAALPEAAEAQRRCRQSPLLLRLQIPEKRAFLLHSGRKA